MNRVHRALIMAAAMSSVVPAIGETVAWWHFNGHDGQEMSSTEVSEVGTYSLSLRTQTETGYTLSGNPIGVSIGAGNLMYSGAEGTVSYNKNVLGATRMFRTSTAASTEGLNCMVGYELSAADTRKLFGDDSGALQSFTVEMLVKVNPHVVAQGESNQGGGLMTVARGSVTGNAQPYVFTLEMMNAGKMQLRCDDPSTGVATSKSLTKDEVNAYLRDGNWHHLAFVYSYDSSRSIGHPVVYIDREPRIDLGEIAALRYQAMSASVRGGIFSVGDVQNRNADLYMDEVKVSNSALTVADFMRFAMTDRNRALYPLAYSAALGTNILGGASGAAIGVTSRLMNPAGELKAAECTVPVAESAVFAEGSSFALPKDLSLVVADGDFTLEAQFKTTASGTQKIVEFGSQFSLSLVGGQLAFVAGTVEKAVGEGLSDGKWHEAAVVYKLKEDGEKADVVVFLDRIGTSVGEIAAFPRVIDDPLVFGRDFGGEIVGLRFEPSGNAGLGMMTARQASSPSTVAHWSADVGTSGTTIGTLAAVDGNPLNALKSGLQGNDATEANRPVYSNAVPCRIVWDADSGKIVNADNKASIYFHNCGSYDGSKWNNSVSGGRLTSGVTGNLGMGYTVEMFVRSTRKFAGNYSCLFNMTMQDASTANARHFMMLDAQYTTRPSLRYYTTGMERRTDRYANDATEFTAGEWHHLALTVDSVTDPQKTTMTLYVDYDQVATHTSIYPLDPVDAGCVLQFGAHSDGSAYEGLVDEIRLSTGVLPTSHFMREFTPRADMTGLWLCNGLDAVEHYQGASLSYLNGSFGASVTDSDDLPLGRTRLKAEGGRAVKVTKSVRFVGDSGFTVPCAAVVGADSFTIEATVKGVGCVAKKERLNGLSWELGFDDAGKPYVRIGDEIACASASVDVSAWHHLALVCDRSSAAKLYVDGVEVATTDASEMQLDNGDMVVGQGFVGNLLGVRFSPVALSSDKFMMACPPEGVLLIVR